MNKLIAIALLFGAFTIAVASAHVGARATYYQSYPYGYQYGPAYGPGYRGYSVQAGVVPAYSSYQPYYQPYYSSGAYYGPSYYQPAYYPYAASLYECIDGV